MMKVKIIALGKLKEKYWAEAVEEYRKRLKGYCDFEIIEITPFRLPDNPSDAEIQSALKKESEEIAKKLPKGAKTVAMCIEGKTTDSEKLSSFVTDVSLCGGIVAFIIGGSYGLHDSIKAAADLKMSMSAMTFPHQLARVMLCEQIYRAFKINEGGTYHK